MARVIAARVFGAVAVSCAIAFCASSARADDAEAAARFREGSTLFDRSEFPAAALLFEESYRLAPRAPTLYNASRSWERAGNRERAADDLYDAIESGNLAAAESKARAHLDDLTQSLGNIDVDVDKDSKFTIDGVERRSGSLRAHVAPGEHHVEVVFVGGQHASRDVDVERGTTTKLHFDPPAVAPPPEVAHVPIPKQLPSPPPPPPPPSIESHVARNIGFVSLGAAAIAVGAAAAFGEIALSAKHDFDPADTNQSEHDRAANFRTAANVAWCTAGVTAAAGAVLIWHPWSPSRGASSARIDIAPNHASFIIPF
jgi:tetratricopeptide (TPR) repeat protein